MLVHFREASFVSKLTIFLCILHHGNNYHELLAQGKEHITNNIEGAMGLGEDEDKESEAVAELEHMKVDEE